MMMGMESKQSEVAVQVRDLWFGWTRKPVLRGLDLDVLRGEVLAIAGSNGAGKSTLLELISGVEPYRSPLMSGIAARLPAWLSLRGSGRRASRIHVGGIDPARDSLRVRSSVAYVRDRTELPAWMRVRDHFELLSALHPAWDAARAQHFLDAFQVDANARYAALSKGQRMLENVAAGLALDVPLLLLDEPFSGLDAVARRLLTEGIIEHMCNRPDAAVVLISHSFVDVERCADRVASMENGRITSVESVEALRARVDGGSLEDAFVASAMGGRAA